MDADKFSLVLEGFLSPEESVRREAEGVFGRLKSSQPDELAALLLKVLRNDTQRERRQQAAVATRSFLRELFIGAKDGNVWPRLRPESKEAIKKELIELAVAEQEAVVRSAIGDILSDLGNALLAVNDWPWIQDAIFKMFQSADVNVQILGLNVCANLASSLRETMQSHIHEIAALLMAKLKIEHNALRVAAIGLIVQIVNNEMRKTWKVFEDFIPVIMLIVTEFAMQEIKETDSDSLSEVLERLIELAETASEFFRPHAQRVLENILALCREDALLDESRQLAAELVMTIVEQKPKMCSKVPGFLDSLIQVLMDFMLDIEEDRQWMERELTCEDDEETRNFDIGECGLDRVASAVGGELAMPVIFSKVGTFLQADDWKHKVAAIVAISQTVEYLPPKNVESQLGEVIDLLLSQLTHEHHRVRFAACRTIGQVALDHQPFVQENYHEKVLPALIATFEDPVARVQSQAFAAFVNFAEEVDFEDLLPVVPTVMEKILLRMDLSFSTPADSKFEPAAVARQHRSIREQCITSVAVISGVLAKRFLPWCPRIVPLMKTIVAQCMGQEDRQLRGRALECLSIIAYSVGAAGMGDDSVQIVNALVALYKTDLDDPVKDYVYEALRRMVKVLAADFAAFVPEVLPDLLATFKIEAEKIDPTADETEDYTLMCLTSGEYSGVKTSKLDDIEQELALLSAMVENMSGAFLPWVQQTMNAVVPLLEMRYSDAVRRLSLGCIADLVAAARAGNAPLHQITQWTLFNMETVFKCVADKEELELCGVDHLTANISGLAKCLDGAGPNVLEKAHIHTICAKVFELIEQSSLRRLDIERQKADPDVNEEDVDGCDDEAEREQIFRENVLRVLEAVIKHHGQHFLETGAPLTLEFVKAFILPTRPADDRSLAVFICCDIIEQLQATGMQMLGPIIEQIILYTHDQDSTVRQASCYAMSLCMSIEGIEAPLVHETAKRLVAVVTDPEANEKDNKDATENAISGLLAIVCHQAAHLGDSLQEHVNLVVSKLPLTSDDEEGQKVHQKLVTLLQDDSSPFWGENKSNVAQLIKIFGAIYKTHLSKDETDVAIRGLIDKIGFANLPSIVSQIQISPTETRGLKKIERDFTEKC